ncbi:porin family protein [Winogradskyella flava]|uniref:PorT family protein n=1 Tax=Winogradskyella flava TaxID=1884876 RepID=A0A842IUH0_9FLAO|nr:porin family protein [Winogradskyella flava]MBC2846812.1 PorT family protein [Winogradskyella flava]
MKKILLSAAIAVLGFTQINAQNDDTISSSSETTFGIKAGYSSVALKVSADGAGSATEDLTGFYFGGFAEINLSEKFALQPELVFGNYSEDGESSGVLLLPILAKYKANEEFSLLAGPQFDYLTNEEDSEGLKRLGLGFTIGAAYDITENVILDARYSFGLSDRFDSDIDEFEDFDIEARFSYFQIGLGYRF